MNLDSLSESIGINNGAISVYLDLIKNGSTNVHSLSLRTSINRTTLYKYLSELEKNKLIEVGHLNKGNSTNVKPLPPSNIQPIIKKKQSELKKINNFIGNLEKQIRQIQKGDKNLPDPKIQIITNYKSLQKEYLRIFSARSVKAIGCSKIIEYFPDNADIFFKGIQRNPQVKVMDILEDSELNRQHIKKIKSHNYSYKLIRYQPFATDLLIYDDNLFIVTGNSKETLVGMLTRNSIILSMAETIFSLLWDMLPTDDNF
ncbi:hypothetical protein JW962_01620 [Candidatus Dojkabacteria bacterium]|nr:hypothetical protein [Candidatus Dojkabacteria bacterium]